MKKLLSAVIFVCLISINSVSFASQDNAIFLKPVTITASRIDSEDIFKSTRSLDSDVSMSFDKSLVDSRTRGPKGIQDDISMRGAPFEETLVLLDGVRINDPQTGHFTMDIPLTKLDIENVGIVYGPSSGFYGSSGIGGAVNIITKPPEERPGVVGEFQGGYYDYYLGAVKANLPFGNMKNKVSFEGSRSGGYRSETEFERIVTNVNSNISFDDGYIDFMFGYMKKDFGADSFYSDVYDNEEEHTDTRLFKLDMVYYRDDVTIRPVVYYRRHWDNFILDRNRRDWYKNYHKNFLYGGELSVLTDSIFGKLVYGGELTWESIDSTSLDDHMRNKQGIFLEKRIELEKWLIDIGVRADRYSDFGWQFNPNIGIGYFINDRLKLRSSFGRSFRAPTFTDLYYSSAANVGNPDLAPEKAYSIDMGVDYKEDALSFSATSFLRLTEDIIDWTRRGTSRVWEAQNIGEFDVYGFEFVFKVLPDKYMGISNLKTVQLKYGYIESFNKESVTSKYVLNHLMHNLIADIEYEIIYGIMQNINVAFKKRIGSSPYVLLNTRIYRDIEIKGVKAQVFVEGENLLDTDYEDNGAIPMPGIWITGGIRIEF